MSERIDHAKYSKMCMDVASDLRSFNEAGADHNLAEAQVHATLALVEQQRIANLIALNEARGPGDPWDFGSPRPPIKPEIREALGLQ